jgi:hypothetical protein
MTVDFANLDTAQACETVFDLELLHPKTDEPMGAFIQIVGRDSSDFRSASVETTNAILKRNFEAQRKGNVKAPTIEDAERNTVKLLAAATRGWYTKTPGKKPGEPDLIEDGLLFGGTRLMFSQEAAANLYANPGYEWLRNQVDKAIGEVGNFLKG